MYRTGPLVAAIVTVLALASCGGGAAGTTDSGATTMSADHAKVAASPTRCVRSSPSSARDSANACPGERGGAQAGDCQKQLGEFVGRMTDLRQSLLAGLSYAEYVVRVRAIRDAYEAVPVKKLDASCLSGPAGDAEDAFNQYLRAANAWGECAGTAGCAASEIEGKLQRRWRIASKSLDQAKQEP